MLCLDGIPPLSVECHLHINAPNQTLSDAAAPCRQVKGTQIRKANADRRIASVFQSSQLNMRWVRLFQILQMSNVESF